MSNENIESGQPSNQSLALFLQDNDADALTDILVEALHEALRIMDEDVRIDTLH